MANQKRLSTGTVGLDVVLHGGFPDGRLYLVEGSPGSGKTTLALQFLLEGKRQGETVLYVTLSESAQELQDTAESHGWDLEGVAVREFIAQPQTLEANAQYTIFHPSELELGETTQAILEEVRRIQPTRIAFDSLSELRLLAQSPLRYRRQLLALKQFFAGSGRTVLLLDDGTSEMGDVDLHSIVHGVVSLEQLAPTYGGERRRLRIVKLRGADYSSGYHDFRIGPGGMDVYPRLVAAEHDTHFSSDPFLSDVPGLDEMTSGGLDRGSSTLIMGPAGSGKSTIAMQYAVAAASRGECSIIFMFDESPETFCMRADSLGLPVRRLIQEGLVQLRRVDPAELSPGEFSMLVQDAVQHTEQPVALVIIDSLNGYMHAMPEERFLTLHLHELLTYLNQQNVATMFIVSQHGLIGSGMQAPVDASYLADAVLLLRYFESHGEVRQAISMVKKRSGDHQRSIREFSMGKGGVQIGPPLVNFEGILSGLPNFVGNREDLFSG